MKLLAVHNSGFPELSFLVVASSIGHRKTATGLKPITATPSAPATQESDVLSHGYPATIHDHHQQQERPHFG